MTDHRWLFSLSAVVVGASLMWLGARLAPLWARNQAHSQLLLAAESAAVTGCEALGRRAPDLETDDVALRYLAGTLLINAACPEQATALLAGSAPDWTRQPVWAYQQGRAAWLQGDEARAVSAWQSDANIGQALLLQAQHASNIDEARRWYEAAIRSSTSPAIQAEAIVVYVEFLRRHLASTDLVARLQNLVSQVGKDTPAGWRLHAQALYERGWQPAAAYTAFSQAIALGFTDSETIHLLGSAAEKLDNLTQAENLYRQALVAVPQIESRRPWHLYRLAMILLKSDRAREAIPLLEEAATSPAGYYLYADQLALTYRAVGDPERSSAACQLAISLAHSNQPVSCQP